MAGLGVLLICLQDQNPLSLGHLRLSLRVLRAPSVLPGVSQLRAHTLPEHRKSKCPCLWIHRERQGRKPAQPSVVAREGSCSHMLRYSIQSRAKDAPWMKTIAPFAGHPSTLGTLLQPCCHQDSPLTPLVDTERTTQSYLLNQTRLLGSSKQSPRNKQLLNGF